MTSTAFPKHFIAVYEHLNTILDSLSREDWSLAIDFGQHQTSLCENDGNRGMYHARRAGTLSLILVSLFVLPARAGLFGLGGRSSRKMAAPPVDEGGVRKTVSLYFEALHECDGSKFDQMWHPGENNPRNPVLTKLLTASARSWEVVRSS
eukprot:2725556-Rhodomonas_salina.1